MIAADLTVSRAAGVLAAAPAALITDIDGTISRIVARPDAAVVSESARASLGALAQRLALVAVITAREERVARRMIGVDELVYVGNYALDGASAAHIGERPLADAEAAVRPLLRDLPCVTLEEKGVAFSLHYRNCHEEGVRERLIALVAPLAEAADARILEGKQVIELVPRALPDKGMAVARLLERNSIRGAVYLGDDRTDVSAFGAVHRWGREQRKPALCVAVVSSEAPEALVSRADYLLAGPHEVCRFLNWAVCQMMRPGGGVAG